MKSDEPTSLAEKWPPPPTSEPIASPQAAPPKSGLWFAILVSIADTIGLFFVWELLTPLFSGEVLHSHHSIQGRLVLDGVIPVLIGLAASYRWRALAFTWGRHMAAIALITAVLAICSFLLMIGLTGGSASSFLSPTSWSFDRFTALIQMVGLLVVASLAGRALFATRRKDQSAAGG